MEAIRRADWHLSTGFVGVGYLLPVLSSTGHDEVAYRLLEQRSAPSWRYMIDHGATTIWERWDGWTAERGFQSASMNSFNHYALGSVGEWLYRFVLGIDQEPGSAGFQRLLIRPHPGGSLRWARGSYESVRGLIRSGWRLDGGPVPVPGRDPAQRRGQCPGAQPGRGGWSGTRPARGPAAVAGFPGAARCPRRRCSRSAPGTHEFTGPRP